MSCPSHEVVKLVYRIPPYYPCVSRCVLRSFFCGIDTYSQQTYEHRHRWIEGINKTPLLVPLLVPSKS